jgi:hypothetical protein
MAFFVFAKNARIPHRAALAPGADCSRSTRLLAWAVLILACLLFGSQLAEIPWRSALRGADNTYNYLWLRSLMVGGDWDFSDDLIDCNTLTEDYRAAGLGMPPTATGLLPNKYGLGWAVVSLPFYLIADGVVVVGRLAGWWTLARDGFNPVYQVTLQVGHFALAALGLFLVHRVLRRWCGPDAAMRGLCLGWVCSPLLYYQTSNLSMSHNVAFLSIAICLWSLVRIRENPTTVGWWLLVGASISLAAITRFQNALFGLVPLWVGWSLRARLPGVLRPLLGLVAGAAPLIVLQLLAWKLVYGQWLVFSYGSGGEGFDFFNPALFQVLLSPFHGLFYWHPMLLVASAGLVVFVCRNPVFGAPLLLTFLLTVYVNASWWCWWFGASFGQRAFDGSMPALMLGLAWLFQHYAGRSGARLYLLGTVLAVMNLVALIFYRMQVIPRNQPVTWLDGAISLFGFN